MTIREGNQKTTQKLWFGLAPYKIVFTNPQSWLCGIISGLLFTPTTIFAMIWGVAVFQEDKSLSFHSATIASALIPMGWVFGCPLLGYLTDRIGKRKPVLIGGAIVMILAILLLFFLKETGKGNSKPVISA